MTKLEAMQIIGIDTNTSFAEAQQIYEENLQKLRLQMLAGNPSSKRVETERMISRLLTAWEVINKTYSTSSYQQPAAQHAQAPQVSPSTTYANTSPSISRQAQIAGILIAVFFMFAVFIICISAYGSYKQRRMAQLRVLSVPWCNVDIDGKSAGQSGQIEAFKVIEGKHYLVFKSKGNLLTKKIKIKRGQNILIKVNFNRRKVDVDE